MPILTAFFSCCKAVLKYQRLCTVIVRVIVTMIPTILNARPLRNSETSGENFNEKNAKIKANSLGSCRLIIRNKTRESFLLLRLCCWK